MALAKYYEDNILIADDRLRDMEGREVFKPNVKKKSSKRKKNRDIFCPKRGAIDIVKREGLFITMEFRQYLFEEQIAALKENGWKWDPRAKCWYAAWSLPNYAFASEFVYGKGSGVPCDVFNVFLDD